MITKCDFNLRRSYFCEKYTLSMYMYIHSTHYVTIVLRVLANKLKLTEYNFQLAEICSAVVDCDLSHNQLGSWSDVRNHKHITIYTRLYPFTYLYTYIASPFLNAQNLGGGVQPYFCPWENCVFSHFSPWEKMGKKYMEREGNEYFSLFFHKNGDGPPKPCRIYDHIDLRLI